MRRQGDLWNRIWTRDNLREAFRKAALGKRHHIEVRHFAAQLEAEVDRLCRAALAGDLSWGVCRTFVIHDPKRRVITAPCFVERVLHHALMNVCEPVFDRRQVFDSYACRRGKGRVRALARAAGFARSQPWFFQFDIRKYFESIDHELLHQALRRVFREASLLSVWKSILAAGAVRPGVGLPIGSLTSQHFANHFLARFDHWITRQPGIAAYVRYMDDMVVWTAHSPARTRLRLQVECWLADELRLTLKPTWQINRTAHGMNFLGCRVFPDQTVLNSRSRRRFLASLRRLEWLHRQGRLPEAELQRRATSLSAFVRAAGDDDVSWRRRVLDFDW